MDRVSQFLAKAQNHFEQEQFEEAEDVLKKAYILDNKNREVIEALLTVYAEQGDIESSLTFVEELLKIDPHDLDTLLHKANCLYDLEELDEASQIYDNIISKKPEHSLALSMRGALHYKRNDFDSSLTDLNRALEIDKNNSIAYYQRASILMDRNQFSNHPSP